MGVLTAVDVTGIQRYVFASNRLRHVVGASELVRHATSRDAGGLLAKALGSNAVPSQHILSAGGGNAILRFAALADAQKFTATYTRSLHVKAPGLEVVVTHREFGQGELAEALTALGVDLAAAKLEQRRSVPLLGLGVTERCASTGQPACDVTTRHDDPDGPAPASASALKAAKALTHAERRWRDLLESGGAAHGADLRFPTQLDDMGRTSGDRSLMGVVHVDGNGIGQAIQDWLRGCVDERVDEHEVICQYRTWSRNLDSLAEKAFSNVVERVIASLAWDNKHSRWKVADAGGSIDVPLTTRSGRTYLPLRPVLVGGDDLTFLCDGRLALDLAVAAARTFQDAVPDPHLGDLSACAGVALVGVRTPVVRAATLAEALCKSAKGERRNQNWPQGAVDWHLGGSVPHGELEALRERVYSGRDDVSLTCRPYVLNGGSAVRSWEWFADALLGEADGGLRSPAWVESHSKAKQLAQTVREGPAVARQTLSSWRLRKPSLTLPHPINADGFDGGRTPLVDAAELLDRSARLG